MDVPLQDAFAEACRALGEAIVRERFLTAELQRQTNPAPRTTQPEEPARDQP